MGDVSSGMASTVIQVYLKAILDSFLHAKAECRLAAVKVIGIILSQGLVHPAQIVPYLICMATDETTKISHAADRDLQVSFRFFQENNISSLIRVMAAAIFFLGYSCFKAKKLDPCTIKQRWYCHKITALLSICFLPSLVFRLWFSLLKGAQTESESVWILEFQFLRACI